MPGSKKGHGKMKFSLLKKRGLACVNAGQNSTEVIRAKTDTGKAFKRTKLTDSRWPIGTAAEYMRIAFLACPQVSRVGGRPSAANKDSWQVGHALSSRYQVVWLISGIVDFTAIKNV